MSMPRYTCMESTETSSTSPSRRASSMATVDFPDAVTPTRATGRGGSPVTGARSPEVVEQGVELEPGAVTRVAVGVEQAPGQLGSEVQDERPGEDGQVPVTVGDA